MPSAGRREQPSIIDAVLVAAVVAVSVAAWASLTLAQVGGRTPLLVVGLTAVVLGGCALFVAQHAPLQWSFSWRDLLLAAGLLIGAAMMFLPGFPYAVADKDPGVYVNTAALIANEGSTSVVDEVAVAEREHGARAARSDAERRHNAAWISPEADHMVQPQFYHLWPALQANVRDLAGNTGVYHLTPLLGALSVALVGLTARRAFGSGVGVLAGALLAVNMMQVWAAKMPGNEIYAQLLLVTAIWGVVIAVRTRWPVAAAVGGFATAFTFLNRPDGLLLVLLAAGLVAAVLLTRRADRMVAWFAAGAAIVLPFAAYQAWIRNVEYSLANHVPTFGRAALVLTAPLGLAAVVRVAGWQGPRDVVDGVVALFGRRHVQLACGAALAVALALGMVIALARPELFGQDWEFSRGGLVRTFNEDNLIRLGWFFTPVGLALFWLGAAVLACERWCLDRWLLALPGLVLLPIYVIDARIASRMMWWTRRFIPVVIVILVVLIALAVVWLWRRRGRLRWPSRAVAIALAGFVLVTTFAQSLPLRQHRELAGTPWVIEELAALPQDETGLFLWANPDTPDIFHPAKLFALPLWFDQGHISVVLPRDATAADLDTWVHAFPDYPAFLLTLNGSEAPIETPAEPPVAEISDRIPVWQEPHSSRPAEPIQGGLPIEIQVWELER